MSTGILITARLKSQRLPEKVMLPIQDRPMICHLIDRLKLTQSVDKIVLCTSPLKQDDRLVDIAQQERIDYFRGDPDDVLLRLTDAAGEHNLGTVLNCTADNPFVDPIYLQRLAEFLHENGYDYACTQGLPIGMYGWAITFPAMEEACKIKDEVDTEVWGGYFTDTGFFQWGSLLADPDDFWPDLRLTVDTPEDFELITRIFDELYTPGKVFSMTQILDLCHKHPELAAINAAIQQKKPIPIKLKPKQTN
ncbi:NTP transferase domain-containing protein [bacterium]|nr:NTP transferase domain-containing protein [bacterium]MBU1651766.1 NTP transferase domain-containing protein [bacterium]MBU1881270.1 NTP transferase domain-containing protein [bacterium]